LRGKDKGEIDEKKREAGSTKSARSDKKLFGRMRQGNDQKRRTQEELRIKQQEESEGTLTTGTGNGISEAQFGRGRRRENS